MVNILCKTCGKEFATKECRLKSGRGVYCSRLCQFEGIKRRYIAECDICGKQFEKRQSKKTLRSYCSKECRKEGGRRYDSERVINWLKDKVGFERKILGLKGEALSRDGYKVYSCKKVHRLIMEKYLNRKLLPTEIIHHINFNKQDNRIENLMVVTRSEHNKIHKFLKTPTGKTKPATIKYNG